MQYTVTVSETNLFHLEVRFPLLWSKSNTLLWTVIRLQSGNTFGVTASSLLKSTKCTRIWKKTCLYWIQWTQWQNQNELRILALFNAQRTLHKPPTIPSSLDNHHHLPKTFVLFPSKRYFWALQYLTHSSSICSHSFLSALRYMYVDYASITACLIIVNFDIVIIFVLMDVRLCAFSNIYTTLL